MLRSAADDTYGYADALADGVVRPVVFMAYSGEARWRDGRGLRKQREYAARLGEPDSIEHTARAWRTALDPAGEWMPAVISAADTRLRQLRDGGIADAGGMIIATDQKAARAYAVLLERHTGEVPTVVVSDDPGCVRQDREVLAGTSSWLVAVRMVSEGVDVPRLAVGVYATSASTPLFFAQAIGRFVRSRRPGETASIFLPSVPSLLGLASELEHNAITCWASRTGRPTKWRPRSAARRALRNGGRVHVVGRRRRTRPGDFRRRLVRHRHPGG